MQMPKRLRKDRLIRQLMEETDNNNLLNLLEKETFCFSCHKNISCFTECCAKLHLVLTPYDILRIKIRLGLKSQDFLSRHTYTRPMYHKIFPAVLLKMDKEKGDRCPFVTKEGCNIYEDRPGACRIYPLARASKAMVGSNRGATSSKEKFFIVSESHCLGFQEKRSWSLAEWLDHEGVSTYNNMNDKWLEIIAQSLPMGTKEELTRKLQMFFMASYNLDRFRDFIFDSNFLNVFQLPAQVRKDIKNDDTSLMMFAFDWLKFSLFGDKSSGLIIQQL